MVVGIALNFFGFQMVGAWTFLAGAVGFGVMQMMQQYDGKDIVIRRLRRMMTLADGVVASSLVRATASR